MPGKKSVTIIGAGTAGLLAARELSRRNIHTIVYDQKRELGMPVRASGILSIKGLGELGIDYPSAITNTLYGANIHAGGAKLRIKANAPVAHVLDRKKLNDICHDEALASGSKVVLGKRMDAKTFESLSANNIMIGADGAVSSVAKHFSMGEIRRYVLTYKAEFNISAEDPSVVDLFFDNKISKGLFGWFCPNTSDILEIGVGIDSRYGNAKTAFEKFIATDYVSKTISGSRRISEGASIIPMSLREKIVDTKKEVLLVGDAAGQVKPSTGGGIIYGGNAALMAARTIQDHINKGASLSEYTTMYNRKYSIDTAIHGLTNAIYSGVGSETLGVAIKIMKAMQLGRLLSKYGDMDMPSLILKNMLISAVGGR